MTTYICRRKSKHLDFLHHSFASHMIEQGVPINNIRSMLGHRFISTSPIKR
ncbi:hypothetical protein D4758_05180 [Enterocloster citroniae]|nr:hypothetical protein [Enterocloster citroniae]